MTIALAPKTPDPAIEKILKIAVMAVGGQGGGVLTGWIESVARSQGYDCQATSVAGVSQRTGATIYYLEMTPSTGTMPVFALAPSEGDVDVLIASEMMEVGRAILRGFVTPDRTTLIGSTHRVLAVSEKSVPGDGIANSHEIRAAAETAAQNLILADMEKIAVEQGSVISATLLGALAGSHALPFSRAAFEDAIRRSGKGVEASLRAFDAGFKIISDGQAQRPDIATPAPKIVGSEKLLAKWEELSGGLDEFPKPVKPLALAGLRKLVDFQDCAYGHAYLDRVRQCLALDSEDRGWALGTAAAKYIANAMAYDDIIRVADIKSRATRLKRIETEMGIEAQKHMQLTEFFHPRAEEIAGLLPAGLGQRVENSEKMMQRLGSWFARGRRLRTDKLPAFLMLHFLGGLKSYRLRTRRHAVEMAHIENWLDQALTTASADYQLAVEILKCHRLVKGYSDTHARAHGKFAKIMAAAGRLKGRKDAAKWVERLRQAALQDPEGKALDGALLTINEFLD